MTDERRTPDPPPPGEPSPESHSDGSPLPTAQPQARLVAWPPNPTRPPETPAAGRDGILDPAAQAAASPELPGDETLATLVSEGLLVEELLKRAMVALVRVEGG